MKKGKTFVVGDVHGANKALLQVLERCGFDNDSDTLISIGDIADGWGETSECVDTLLGIKNLIAIRGNHDVWVYDWIEKGHTPILWTEQGGRATLESYIRTGRFLDQDHKDFWLKTQRDWYIDGEDRLFIHAGWAYMDGKQSYGLELSERELFEKQASFPVNAGSIAKECHWDRDIYMGARSASVGNNGRFKAIEQFKEVFIGHTATRSHLPENHLNLWNLDSGCGWHGKLTIMDIDTKEYWQSDFAYELYPDEKRRR